MRDPDFDSEPGIKWLDSEQYIMTPVDANGHLMEPSGQRLDARKRFGPRSILFAGMTFLAACWLVLASHSNRRYTCAVCREGKVESRLLGLSWASQHETDCSQWYRENVEPSHAHAWAGRGYCQPMGFLGLGGVACSIGSRITMLSESEQVKIYEHFENRLEAKQIFMRLARRDDEDDELYIALLRWIDQDYPGTWHDWWEKHRDSGER
jgi:hypothetical protein